MSITAQQSIPAVKSAPLTDPSLRKAAEDFEALFVQMMLQSMRKTSFGDGLLDNDQSQFYREMLDQQMSMHMAREHQIGIADLVIQQLRATQPHGPQHDSVKPATIGHTEKPVRQASTTARVPAADPPLPSPQDFVKRFYPMAKKAAASINADPKALLAQAALETGWGKYIPKAGDGASSYNLFGIKAGGQWQGLSVTVGSLEVDQGQVVRRASPFRRYGSYEESFMDYAAFLKTNPRYRAVLGQGHDNRAYFQALQDAGYATDPKYADKLLNIIDGSTLSQALSQLKVNAG